MLAAPRAARARRPTASGGASTRRSAARCSAQIVSVGAALAAGVAVYVAAVLAMRDPGGRSRSATLLAGSPQARLNDRKIVAICVPRFSQDALVASRRMRVGVYVDGFNLYFGARSVCGRGTRGWRWLDLRALAERCARWRAGSTRGAYVDRVVYCTARVSGVEDRTSPADQEVYLRASARSRKRRLDRVRHASSRARRSRRWPSATSAGARARASAVASAGPERHRRAVSTVQRSWSLTSTARRRGPT